MVEAIIKDKKRVLPCAVQLEGEYGINGLYVGVLAKIGSHGLEQVIELQLNETEKTMLKKSADSVQGLIQVLEGK